MGIVIHEGDIVDISKMKYGTSDKGDWVLIPVIDNKRRMTIWAENASEVKEFVNKAKIIKITSFKYGARKDKNGEWQNDISVTAIFDRLSDADIFSSDGFSEAFEPDDSSMPFN